MAVKVKNLVVETGREEFTFNGWDNTFTQYLNTCKISFDIVYADGTIVSYRTDPFGKGLWEYCKKEGFYNQIRGICDVNFKCKSKSGIYKKIRRFFEDR